jgi:hypothetical protein
MVLLYASYMDERADEIEEKLTAYSTETGNTSIYGAEHYATVSTTTSVDVPKAGSEPRAELESALKSLGLWDQVDQLSPSKLKKLAPSGRQPMWWWRRWRSVQHRRSRCCRSRSSTPSASPLSRQPVHPYNLRTIKPSKYNKNWI